MLIECCYFQNYTTVHNTDLYIYFNFWTTLFSKIMPNFWCTDFPRRNFALGFLAKNLTLLDLPSLKFHNRTDIKYTCWICYMKILVIVMGFAHQCQFGCGILKVVGPKMQDFYPRINMLKGIFFKKIFLWLTVRQKVTKSYFQSQFSMSKII